MTDELNNANWKLYGSCFTPRSRWIGVIARLTNFGAFVDLPGHLSGLLHISEMSDKYVASVEDVVAIGQLVTVTILHVDLKDQRIRVSLTQAAADGTPVQSSPIEIRVDWLTENVLGLAKAIQLGGYRDRTVVAILADALEEAGCEAEALLSYCRGTQTQAERHGWWVAETILRASPKPAEPGTVPTV